MLSPDSPLIFNVDTGTIFFVLFIIISPKYHYRIEREAYQDYYSFI